MLRPLRALLLVLLCLPCLGFEWEGRLSRLTRELQTAEAPRRREVIRLLAAYPSSEVGPAVLDALDDDDPNVRAEAASAAGRLGLEDAIPPLLDWLDDPDPPLRVAALAALGALGDSRTTAALVRALGDAEPAVRRQAIASLGAIGGAPVIVPILGRLDDDDATVRRAAAVALGTLDDRRAVVPLMGKSRDDSAEVRLACVVALGELGDPRALPILFSGLDDSSDDVRLAAVAALGRSGSARAVPALTALVSEQNPRLARAAIAALGAIEAPDATEALIAGLRWRSTRTAAHDSLLARARRASERENAELGRAIVSALRGARIGGHATALATTLADLLELAQSPEVAPSILRAMEDHPEQRASLMRALAATGSERALVPILDALRSSEATTEAAALTALELYFELHPVDGRAADPLLHALARVSPGSRVVVVRLLGQVGASRALPAIRPLLSHEDAELRRAAVAAIGAIGDPEGAAALEDLLDDRDPRTRFEAASALGAAADADTLRGLLERIESPESADRHSLLLALGAGLSRLERADDDVPDDLSERSLRVLSSLTTGPDLRLAARAVDALTRWASPAVVPPLMALSERDPGALGRQATFSLGLLDDARARDLLRAALVGPDRRLAAQAAAGLEASTDASFLPLLLEALEGPFPLRSAAAFALARWGRRDVLPADAAPALCRAASSRDPYTRANATLALAAIEAPPCPEVDPASWLAPTHAAVVRVAAARWLDSAGRAGRLSRREVERALDTCAQRDLTSEVVAACLAPGGTSPNAEVDAYAYEGDGRTLLMDHPVALRLADGATLLVQTDLNGHIRFPDAPEGPVLLDDPLATPLEP